MNFEELIQSKNQNSKDQLLLPLGALQRVQIDQRTYQLITIKTELTDNRTFQDDLKAHFSHIATLPSKSHVRFCPLASLEELQGDQGKQEGNARYIVLEQGAWISFEKMLQENPPLVADDRFIAEVTNQLFSSLEASHRQGIRHLCLAPSLVLVRKGEHTPALLHCGSFYTNLHAASKLYQGMEEYVAPEVLSNQNADERSDIYSLGKLLEHVFQFSSVPYTYKKVIKKATQPVSEDRYQTVAEMKKALYRLQKGYQATLAVAIAALISAVIYFGLNTFTPQPEDMEYVKPAQADSTEDVLDKGFDAETEFGPKMAIDSGLQLTTDEIQQMKEYESKAEAIFKKQFAAKAEQILGKAYNKNTMKGNEKSFKATSLHMTEELIQAQKELAKESGISNTKSEKIAAEIIDQISEKMMKEALK